MGIDVHCFNSFFIKKLTEQGYKAVQRWTRKIDIFSKKRVIVPVNTNNVCISLFDLFYIDSLDNGCH